MNLETTIKELYESVCDISSDVDSSVAHKVWFDEESGKMRYEPVQLYPESEFARKNK